MTDERLGRIASRGALATVVGQGLRVLAQTLGLVLMARLLAPGDYGLVAITVSLVGLGELIRDFGLSTASVQARALSADQRGNLLLINVAIGVLVAVLLVAISPLVAHLFGDTRLRTLLMVMSIGLALNAFAAQYRADLTRLHQFSYLALVDLVSLVCATTLGIATAALGIGYWSLVCVQLANAALGAGFLAIRCRWFPRKYVRQLNMREFFSFGAGLFGAQLVSYGAKNADTAILGLTVGSASLGLYNRAMQLLLLPLYQLQAPASRVAVPILSRLQDDERRFENFLMAGHTVIVTAACAVIAMSSSSAPSLFPLVLGEQWASAAPIYRYLAVSGYASAATYVCLWFMVARAQTRHYFFLSLVSSCLIFVAILAGSTAGVPGVAIGLSCAQLALVPINFWWLARLGCGCSRQLWLISVRAGFVWLIAATAGAWLGRRMEGEGEAAAVVVALSSCLAIAALIYLLPVLRQDLARMRMVMSSLRGLRREEASVDG